MRISEECVNEVRMTELSSVPPARQVAGKVRQGDNKKKKDPEIKAKQGISKHQKCRTLEVKSQRYPLVITDYITGFYLIHEK